MTKTDGKRVTANQEKSGDELVKTARVRRAGKTVAPISDAESRPVRNYKTHTKKLIAEQFSGIMESIAVKSKQGSLAHAKFLFELGGVKKELERQGRDKREPSLADLLQAEVRRQQAESGPAIRGFLGTGEAPRPAAADETDEGVTD